VSRGGVPIAADAGSGSGGAGAGLQAAIHLLEHKVLAHLDAEEKEHVADSWVLDTGATNHMSGSRAAFTELDAAVCGTVRFGDDSVARIEGCGTIVFRCENGEQCAFRGVYYIPQLTTNIMSIGQLDEVGYKIIVDDGVMTIREPGRKLLARIRRLANRLYVLNINVAQPVALASCTQEEARRWHARLGHVNMAALRKMAQEELMRGLPAIDHDDRLCEACLAGKQRRTSFPEQAEYRVQQALELVHGDLCGPITPETPSGSKYFLLLVDDCSRFMWLTVLPSKDRAAAAIKEFQARAEGESGLKLGALRTDRGGEFTSIEFAEHCAAEGV